MMRSFVRAPRIETTLPPASRTPRAIGSTTAVPMPPPTQQTRWPGSMWVGSPSGPATSWMLSPGSMAFSWRVVLPTPWTTSAIAPRAVSESAMVERNAFTAFAEPDDHELTGTTLAGDGRRLDPEPDDVRGQELPRENTMHVIGPLSACRKGGKWRSHSKQSKKRARPCPCRPWHAGDPDHWMAEGMRRFFVKTRARRSCRKPGGWGGPTAFTKGTKHTKATKACHAEAGRAPARGAGSGGAKARRRKQRWDLWLLAVVGLCASDRALRGATGRTKRRAETHPPA